MKNKEIAEILFAFSELLVMESEPFKPRAYEKAAHTIESLDRDVADIYNEGGVGALEKIPGVGKGIAAKVEEYLETGKVKEYELMKKKNPIHFEELRHIEGLGPKMIKVLYKKLKITDVVSLKKAAKEGKIRRLARFGEKSESKILKGIEFFEASAGRFLLSEALPIARTFEKRLRKQKGVKRVDAAGSIRRMQETIGDIDILAIARDPKPIMDFFVRQPEVARIIARGETKSAVKLKSGISIDLRVVPDKSYGAALQYFTGSKDHNILVRAHAIKKGYKLNEYGLYKNKKRIAGATEESIYRALELPMQIPELRQGRDELTHTYRGVIGYDDLRGDLQIQTNWTDGLDSIETMVRAAEKIGHEYIGITDHTRSLAMTRGADEKKLIRQMSEIDRMQKKFKHIKILKGAEVNITKDGLLDIDDAVLSDLDVVGAAVHSHFLLGEEEQTERIMRAISNEHVDILFHPTGRVLHKREQYRVTIGRVMEHAAHTHTVLEIDAHPERLDLNDEHIRAGIKTGVLFAIDSDAHAVAHLSFLMYGIGQARRAGLPRTRVINTFPYAVLKAFLQTPKKRRRR